MAVLQRITSTGKVYDSQKGHIYIREHNRENPAINAEHLLFIEFDSDGKFTHMLNLTHIEATELFMELAKRMAKKLNPELNVSVEVRRRQEG